MMLEELMQKLSNFLLNSKYVFFWCRAMRTFEESQKSKKTVSSMIENKKDEKKAVKVKDNKNSKCKWAPSFFSLCGIQTGLFPIISWRSLSVITIIAFCIC